ETHRTAHRTPEGNRLMTETPVPPRDDLLKKINSKLGWIVFLLVLITLNTCSLSDDLSDAARDLRRATPTEAAPEKG
ncbi:MAG: hypothetical protein ACXW3O_06390, partial [Brevundimonas sp.]